MRPRHFLLVVAAACLWGTGGVLGTVLAADGAVPPASVAMWRMVIAGAVLTAWLAARRSLLLGAVTAPMWRRVLATGALTAVFEVLYFTGIVLAGVGLATLVTIGSAPVWVAVWDAARERRLPGPRRLTALVLALAGLAALLGTSLTAGDRAVLGVGIAVVTGAVFAGVTLVNRSPVPGLGAARLTALAFSAGGIMLIPVALVVGWGAPAGLGGWGVALALGVASTALAYYAYLTGLETVPPFVATVVLGLGGSWRVPYGIYVAIQLSLLAGFALTRDRWSVRPVDDADEVEAEGGQGGAPSSVVGLSIVEFFLYTGLEVGTGVLAFTLLTEGRGVSDGAAGLWTTAYWASLTAGRVLLGAAGSRVGPEQVLRRGTAVAVAGTLLLALDPFGIGAVGLPILGLALAGLFPSMVLLTPRRVGPERTAGQVGIQFSVAAIGASGVPAAISWWATDDVERIGPALVVLAVAVAAIDVAVSQLSRVSRSSR